MPFADQKSAVRHLLIVVLSLCAGSSLWAKDYPGYSLEETITEYDVDPTWPKKPAHVAAFGWVSGMAIDKEQRIWLFNKGNNPVQVYTKDGEFVRTWGEKSFVDPHHLRIDSEGNIWVADFGLHIVQKYTPEGKLLLTLGVRGESGEDDKHFYRPTDMAITPSGDIFVTDGYGNRRIVHYDKEGKFVKAWGKFGSKPGEFVLPHAIALDSQGKLYVADRNSARIQIFDQSGKFLDQWSNLIMPWGLSINARDEIWVCGSTPHWWYRNGKYPDVRDQVLMRFDTAGKVKQVWSVPLGVKGMPKPGDLIWGHCIVQDAEGNLYVGDIEGLRAQKFVPVTKRPPSDLKPKK
ncbi:MAG: peptidyl-alpha-hydroxyglycine alpha-amidating lyase family protein [Planctomycetales bacterium]